MNILPLLLDIGFINDIGENYRLVRVKESPYMYSGIYGTSFDQELFLYTKDTNGVYNLILQRTNFVPIRIEVTDKNEKLVYDFISNHFGKECIRDFKIKKNIMKQELFNLIDQKSPGARPLYLVIRGSHAYGTNIETSDTDYAGVFIQSMDDILGNSYKEQINDDKNDIVIYELRRFIELLASNNPTVLELLNTPEDCVIYKDPIFDMVLENKSKFITKVCGKSFGGYARQQISKAKGQDKKQNWEKDKVTRKTPLDFCYIHRAEYSIPLKDFLKSNKLDQRFCGLSNVPHSRDTYALFYDKMSDYRFSESRPKWERFLNNLLNSVKPLGFKGIAFEGSNELRLSSIPKDLPNSYFLGHISYNKDGYSQHCKDYNSYQTWIKERNESRWVDVKSHGQKIDGKNMMHCMRLMQMAREIGEGKGIIVRRPNAQELIDIRKGKVDLQSLINHVESEIQEVDKLFKESDLPNSVDVDFTSELIKKIRKEIYKLNK